MQPLMKPQPLGALDFVMRWRPNCHCWTSEPLFHG